MELYKYQGAGNDFLIADNRSGKITSHDGKIISSEGKVYLISDLCDRRYGIGADGLMLLENAQDADFKMVYFNSDGSGGMMCGNGGRCIVAFAADLGLESFDFFAADGFHTAEVLASSVKCKTVRLKMKDVAECRYYPILGDVEVASEGYFLDTGTRHYVRFVDNISDRDVVAEGRAIRYGAREFLPVGVNVNFVEPVDGVVKVRTYEKGVEDETFACGTGIVASCVASYVRGVAPSSVNGDRVKYDVRAVRDSLSVDFLPDPSSLVKDVWLTGPATYVAKVLI